MKLGYKLGMAAVLTLLTAVSGISADLAILRNGFAIRHEHREVRESMTRLYLTSGNDSFVDVPTYEIGSYERVESPSIVPAPSVAPSAGLEENINQVISKASLQNGIDPDLIISVIRAESGFNPQAISNKGAQGLMQLMPRTAASLGVADPLDPAANVEAGTRYLKELLDIFHGDAIKALAAYNAGPERVALYRGVPPYSETRSYVARILSDFNRAKLAKREGGTHRGKPSGGKPAVGSSMPTSGKSAEDTSLGSPQ